METLSRPIESAGDDWSAPSPLHDFAFHVRAQLGLLGEDPAREGLIKTPDRVAAAMQWMTRGYGQTAEEVVGDALFTEDHENMVENLLMWTRDSKNKIYFVERDEKFDMFVNPQRYFLESRMSHGST